MPDFHRNPFEELEDMQRQMDRFLDHVTGAKRPPCFYAPSPWQPAMDIYETAEDLVVVLESAGLDRDSLEISLDRNTLTIYGQRQDVPPHVRQKYHMAEINFGGFQRVIQVPVPVDSDRASWSYQEGMLVIVFPKASDRVAKRVRIKAL